MIYVIARIECFPGQRQAYLDAFAKNAPIVRAKPGCMQYSATTDFSPAVGWQHDNGADVATIVERWSDIEALRVHNDSPHMATVRAAMSGFVKARTIHILSPLE